MLQEYYDRINNGEKYTCDKCGLVNLSAHEYTQFIQYQYHYCEPCWNYVHLKQGTCSNCGSQYTNRNEYDKIFIDCPCGNKVKLTWQ